MASIGLPVFNGEQFLARSIESILGQDTENFELLISDNGSTDSTPDICARYAKMDSRIEYSRLPDNIGAAANYNRVFELSTGKYFKWAAHDDVCQPGFLQACIDELDNNPQLVLCHSLSEAIDHRGKRLGLYEHEPDAMDNTCWRRFANVILKPHYCIPVFGVMRRAVLEQTIRHGDWVGADRNLLAELALYGRVRLLPEVLFQRRHHPDSSISKFPDERQRAAWFQAQHGVKRVYPTWRRLHEYLAAIRRTPLSPAERLTCRATLLRWLASRHHAGQVNALLMLRELGPMPKTG